MKAVILAGGFAKRMLPLTKDMPKHLLPVGGRPMLDYILVKLEALHAVEKLYVSTNAKFKDKFEEYLRQRNTKKDVTLFIEDSHSEKEKLGSVGALGYLITKCGIDEELLVIGGDNIFDFDLADFLSHFRLKATNVVALCDLKSRAKARLFGVSVLSPDGKIIDFQEKPSEPRSTIVSTACYAFTRKGVRNILRYLSEGNDPDKMGHFIEWLYKNDEIYGFIFDGIWFDIGSFDSYNKANEYFLNLAAQ